VTERDVLGGDRIRRYTRARMSWAAEPGRADDAAGAPHDLLLLGPPGRLLGLEALNVRERRMPPVPSEIVLRAEHRIVTLGAVRLRTDEELSRAWGGRTDGRLLVHRTVAGRAWLGPATERGGRRTAGHRDDRSFTPSSHDRRADQPLHVARVRRGGLPLAPARRARVRTRLKENSDPKVLTPLTNAGVGSAIRRWRSHRVCGASRRTQPTTLRCRPGTATVSCLWATAGARRTESERSCAAPERFRLRRDALFSRRP
jgi:hypothetical protein